MNPLRVRAANYRTFEDVDVALPPGCTAIVGQNGAGKSSILNLVELGLFGQRSMAPLLTEGASDPLAVELMFEHRHAIYRVRRVYDPSGRGKTTLDFEVDAAVLGADDAGFWEPLTRSSMAETQALIEQRIGLSRDTFRASCFLAQGDGAAFTEALPAKRKEILAEVLGLEIWDRLLKQARELLAVRERTIADQVAQRNLLSELAENVVALENDLRAAIESLEARNVEIADTSRALEEAREKYARERERVAQAETARAEKHAAQERLATLRAQARRAEEARVEIEEALKERAELEGPVATLDEWVATAERERQRMEDHRLKMVTFEQQKRAVSQHTEEIGRLVDAELAAERRIREVTEAEVSHCVACGQELDTTARATLLAQLERERDAAHEATAAHEKKAPAEPEDPGDAPTTVALEEANGKIAILRTAQNEIVKIDARVETLRRIEPPDPEELEQAERRARDTSAKFLEFDAEMPDLGKLRAEGERLANELTGLREWQQRKDREVAATRVRLEQAQEAEKKLAVLSREIDELAGDKALLELAVRAYGRDGVPALLVEQMAVPQIEAEANALLVELGTDYSVELRTQRQTQAGEIREALDIIVQTPFGERAYETFSGGERTRLNLALRIGLARLLAHRRGADVRMLAIDEPEFLDDDGVEALSAVLQTRLSSDFDRILLVSHMPALRESFPQALVVSKTGERSTVDTGEAAA